MTEPPRPDRPPPPDSPEPESHRHSPGYVYMLPFAFSCLVLTVVPLLGELLAALTGGGSLDFSALRPLALLTGAGFSLILLMRGLAPDYQIFTVVSLVLSLALALLENMLAGQAILFGGIVLQHSLETMSTFVQATFFSAAAAAAWLAPVDDPEQPAPPDFLRWVLAVLASAHFLLPCDMVLQSIFAYWPNTLVQASAHSYLRVGLWCLVAVCVLLYGQLHLRRQERQENSGASPPRTPPPGR